MSRLSASKLLVVSHPCSAPINQEVFAQLADGKHWRVSIVLPARWKSEYGVLSATRWPSFKGRLHPRPVLLSGNIPLHVYAARLRRIIADERPDAIYVQHEPYAAATYQVFVAARRFEVPLAFFSCQNLHKAYPWPFSAMERYVYRHARLAFPVSDAVSDVLRAKGYEGAIQVLPFAVDSTRYSPAEGAAQPIDARRPLRVGFVGRLTAEKGIDTLLSALSFLSAAEARAVIVGDGPAASGLKERARRLGLDDRLQWRGYIPHAEMAPVYRGLDLVAVPSKTVARWKEQFGRVVIEALACGTPVVTSDSGELPQLVSTTGGGWVFPEGDARALASIIGRLNRERRPLAERGRRGRTAVRQRFDTAAIADQLALALDGMIGRADAA